MISIIQRIKNKVVARLLDKVYVEKIDNPIDGRIAKIEYGGRKAYIQERKGSYVLYLDHGEYGFVESGPVYSSYEDAEEGGKDILKG